MSVKRTVERTRSTVPPPRTPVRNSSTSSNTAPRGVRSPPVVVARLDLDERGAGHMLGDVATGHDVGVVDELNHQSRNANSATDGAHVALERHLQQGARRRGARAAPTGSIPPLAETGRHRRRWERTERPSQRSAPGRGFGGIEHHLLDDLGRDALRVVDVDHDAREPVDDDQRANPLRMGGGKEQRDRAGL